MRVVVPSLVVLLNWRPLHLVSGLVVLACGLMASVAAATEPDLKGIFPSCCTAGTDIEITLVGSGLEDAKSVYFSHQGITAEHVEKARYRVTVDADAQVGDCEFWLATSEGLAGPRRFSVTASPVALERESNDAKDEAQTVSVSSVIAARLDKAADLDWFAFDSEKDQVISIAGRSLSLDGNAQLFFTLVGPSGSEVAHSASHMLEPLLKHTCQTSGTYRLLVHDRAYRKDDFSSYQIELTVEDQVVTPARRVESLVQPDDLFASIEAQSEKDHSPETPQAVQLPSRITGQLVERNEVDWFSFQATKDQVLHIEAFGERLGQLMDLEVTVHSSDKKLLKTFSDLTVPKGLPTTLPMASLDPAADWTAPADSDYLLAVRDLYGSSIYGTDRNYELIVSPPQPNATVFAMPSVAKPSCGVFVKQGSNAELSLTLLRSGGLTSPVSIRPIEPVVGLTLDDCVFNDKEATKTLKISAAKDALTGFHLLRLVAETKIDSDTQTIPVRSAIQTRPGVTRRVDEMVIYVSE